MATTSRKEVVSLYLETQGKDLKGNDLKEKKSVEDAKKELIENVVSSLSKSYAQLEIGKKYGLITENEADKIIKSAKDASPKNAKKKNRKQWYINDMIEKIEKALGTNEEEGDDDLF